MPPKRKVEGDEGDSGGELDIERQRARLDVRSAHVPVQAQEYRLPPRGEPRGGSAINVSRASVLIAWVTVVAQRQGYSRDAGLSFGKAVAAMLALKGRSASTCAGKDATLRRQREALLNVRVADVFGMQVKAVEYGKGDVRAVEGCQAIDAVKVHDYLVRAFDGRLVEAEAAFAELAEAYAADEIGSEAYRLFKEFRPDAPPGHPGGARAQKGALRLDRLRELAADARAK